MRDEDVLDWEWISANRTSKWPRIVCQHLAHRARTDPNDVIVSDGHHPLTADEFAHRAAAIAHRLLDDGSDRPVVLLMNRSLTSAAALFGVQWAGRCMVPLDASDPATRLIDIANRMGECTIADATGEVGRHLGARPVIDLTTASPRWVDPVPVSGDDPALIVFTSGSTGAPKGVVRRGWQDDNGPLRIRADFPNQKRSAILMPLNWLGGSAPLRMSMKEGFALIMDPRTMSAREVLDTWHRHGIDIVHATPSLMESLSTSLMGESGVESVECIRFLGEPARWSAIQAARSVAGPTVRVCVIYGASEALGTIARLDVGPEVPISTEQLPLGTVAGDFVRTEAIDGDSGLHELVVHNWVSNGYWDELSGSGDSFRVDDNGDPCWHSGDLVEIDAKGVLRFVGRRDDVVKIAGKLASPSEAAAVLGACQGVRKVVVLPRRLANGRHQLVAHVEVDVGVDPVTLRKKLVERLPRHLVPAVLVRHDVLPLLPGGKVDRQRLLSLPVVPWRVGVLREPRTKLEVFVLREVSLLLGVAGLGVDDDVWAFGLDSLGAIELTEVLTRHFSTSLGVNDFVGASTVAALARLLAGNRVDRVSHVVDFGPEGAGRSVFVFAGGGAPVLQIRHLAAELMGECRVFGVEQYGLQQRHRPDRSVRASARRNIAEITSVQPHGPYVLVGHSWGGLVAHEMACELRRAGYEVWLVLLDTANPTGGVSSDYVDGVAAAIDVPAQWRHGGRGRLRDWRWLVHRLGNHVRRFTTPANRYWEFFRVAARSARRHRPQVFGGPMLVVDADHSTASATWSAEPGVRSVQLSGNHRSILDPPHVNALAQTITSFVKECQEGSTAPRAV